LPQLTLELDENVVLSTCARCGTESPRVHGFVYRDGNAWAVYWAELYKDHPQHPDSRALVTIALGEDWSEPADPVNRAWAQLDVWPDHDEIRMGFIDPTAILDQAYFGRPLSRENVLSDARKDAFLGIADKIVYGDPRVAALLGTSNRVD